MMMPCLWLLNRSFKRAKKLIEGLRLSVTYCVSLFPNVSPLLLRRFLCPIVSFLSQCSVPNQYTEQHPVKV